MNIYIHIYIQYTYTYIIYIYNHIYIYIPGCLTGGTLFVGTASIAYVFSREIPGLRVATFDQGQRSIALFRLEIRVGLLLEGTGRRKLVCNSGIRPPCTATEALPRQLSPSARPNATELLLSPSRCGNFMVQKR